MGGNGVSDISTRAGEGVSGVVNGAGLTSGSIARSGASGGGSTVGMVTGVDNELTKVRGFRKVIHGGLVRRSWVDGSEERIWKPSLRLCLRR